MTNVMKQFYEGPEGNLKSFVRRLYDHFLRPEKSREPKKGYLPVTKDFGLFFLVLSGVTNLRRKLVRVQKIFWQLLWK